MRHCTQTNTLNLRQMFCQILLDTVLQVSFEPYASVVDVANLFFGRNQTLLLLTNQTQVLEHDFEHALVTVALLCKNIL